MEAYILNKIRESYDENDKSTGNAKLKNTNLKVAQNKAKSKIDEILKKFDLLAKDQNMYEGGYWFEILLFNMRMFII